MQRYTCRPGVPFTVVLTKMDLLDDAECSHRPEARARLLQLQFECPEPAKAFGADYVRHLEGGGGISAERGRGVHRAPAPPRRIVSRAFRCARKPPPMCCNSSRAFELFAEDLRMAQMALSEITGEFTSDDLLGEIFSSFCIGK